MKLNFNYKVDFEKLLNIKDNMVLNDKSVLFIVDMNNGFAKAGVLYSDRVEAIIPEVVKTTELFIKEQRPVIAFTDRHTDKSPEFLSYPPHCLEGTEETEIIDELKVFGEKIHIIPKNSTNGFLEEATQEKVNELINEGVKNWVVVGCCTDICIKLFSINLKNYFNKLNIDNNVIVPINAVETYDAPWHNGDAMNLFSLLDLQSNGIILVNNVK